MDIVKLARDIATEAHKGQYRRKGKNSDGDKVPYITHPERVVRLINDTLLTIYNRNCKESKDQRSILPDVFVYAGYHNSVFLATGWLHDVLEDTKVTVAYLRSKFYACYADYCMSHWQPSETDQISTVGKWNMVIHSVELLTKHNDQNYNYVTYLEKIAANPVTKLGKLADVNDNMSDLDRQSSLYEKYELTRAYLQGKLSTAQPLPPH